MGKTHPPAKPVKRTKPTKPVKRAPKMTASKMIAAAVVTQTAEIIAISEELGTLAEKKLLELIEAGVPVSTLGQTPQTAAYISALQLALKRSGRLVEKTQQELSGTVQHTVFLPRRELITK